MTVTFGCWAWKACADSQARGRTVVASIGDDDDAARSRRVPAPSIICAALGGRRQYRRLAAGLGFEFGESAANGVCAFVRGREGEQRSSRPRRRASVDRRKKEAPRWLAWARGHAPGEGGLGHVQLDGALDLAGHAVGGVDHEHEGGRALIGLGPGVRGGDGRAGRPGRTTISAAHSLRFPLSRRTAGSAGQTPSSLCCSGITL